MFALTRPVEPYDENTDVSVKVSEGEGNGFGGIDTPDMQVLKSAAGYYIGCLCQESDGQYYPNFRDSECFYQTRDIANKAFLTGNYPIKF